MSIGQERIFFWNLYCFTEWRNLLCVLLRKKESRSATLWKFVIQPCHIAWILHGQQVYFEPEIFWEKSVTFFKHIWVSQQIFFPQLQSNVKFQKVKLIFKQSLSMSFFKNWTDLSQRLQTKPNLWVCLFWFCPVLIYSNVQEKNVILDCGSSFIDTMIKAKLEEQLMPQPKATEKVIKSDRE